MTNLKFLRNLIEAGYTDAEIEAVLKLKEAKPEPEKKTDPEPKPEPGKKTDPEQKPDTGNNDLILAIKSLETTIKASNLINSVLDTQSTEKTADDVLAEMLAPKGGNK